MLLISLALTVADLSPAQQPRCQVEAADRAGCLFAALSAPSTASASPRSGGRSRVMVKGSVCSCASWRTDVGWIPWRCAMMANRQISLLTL
jgi:hypothetical protein